MLIYGYTVADMYHNICFVGVEGRVGGEDEEKRRRKKEEESEEGRRKKHIDQVVASRRWRAKWRE